MRSYEYLLPVADVCVRGSALVGGGILLLTLPLPGYLVKLRTSTQKMQMKKVGCLVVQSVVPTHADL